LKVFNDESLSYNEQILRNTIESEIGNCISYSALYNEKQDRGEIKTLSFMAVKEYKYLVSNDNDCVIIVRNKLPNCSIIFTYELIYLLSEIYPKKAEDLRKLYRFLYYSISKDKQHNPSRSDFKTKMSILYKSSLPILKEISKQRQI
jgi:hypothetical protein